MARELTEFSPSEFRKTDSELWVWGAKNGNRAVTADEAMSVAAVFCAVNVISSSVAKLPLFPYRKQPDGSRIRDAKHPLYSTLARRPNPMMTSFELKEFIVATLLLRGNCYLQKIVTNDGRLYLFPMNSDRMRPRFDSKLLEMVYEYQAPQGRIVFWADEILHIKGVLSNGVVGQSVIELGRLSLAKAYQADQHASEYFENDATPSGVIECPVELEQEARDNVKAGWQAAHSGSGNRHKVAMLEFGMKWNPISFTNKDSQFLESRQFEIEEISRWFNIPPHKLKHLLRSTYSNIEQQALEFYEDCVLPWTERIQSAITSAFFADDPTRYVEFVFDKLLYTDTTTRYQAHNIALQGGWRSRNEVRELENENRVDGLDEYLMPLNMVSVSKVPGDAQDSNALSKRASASILEALKNEMLKIQGIEANELERTAKRGLDKVKLSNFYDKHIEQMRSRIDFLVDALVVTHNDPSLEKRTVVDWLIGLVETRRDRLLADDFDIRLDELRTKIDLEILK